jgi:hypothetical protein
MASGEAGCYLELVPHPKHGERLLEAFMAHLRDHCEP